MQQNLRIMRGTQQARTMWSIYWATAFAIVFLVATRLVPNWGQWYSGALAYRHQTDAFLRGSLALQDTPTALAMDLVWYDGGVHQVWGLGVPAWRLPFELIARAFGQPAFPDRLAFGIALALVAFAAIKIFLLDTLESQERRWDDILRRVVGVGVLLLFPPFVSLCYFHFDVYEEAVCYGYLYSVGLFLAVMSFEKKPSLTMFYLFSMLAGMAPFVRPTLGAYGIATQLLLILHARKCKFSWTRILPGVLCFSACIVLLCTVNQEMFGSPLEFGHSLNLNGFPNSYYTRFYNPFSKAPFFSALRELFGVLFCNPKLNGIDWTRLALFWGESSIPRYRRFYANSFDISFCILVLAAWSFAAWRFIAARRKSTEILMTPFVTGQVWPFISVIILAGFYLRLPFMENRYALDFAAAFAVSISGMVVNVEFPHWTDFRAKRWLQMILVTLLPLWMGWELLSAKTNVHPIPTMDRNTLLHMLSRPIAECPSLPNAYTCGQELDHIYQIPYDGNGWNPVSGRMGTVVTLFVSDPNCLRVEAQPTSPYLAVDYSKLEAKVGLEFLKVESIQKEGDSCIVTFRGPSRKQYQEGIQVVFLAYVDKDIPRSKSSPLRLLHVQWGP